MINGNSVYHHGTSSMGGAVNSLGDTTASSPLLARILGIIEQR